MNKTRTYRSGKLTCRSYIKNIGNNWEIGFIFGKRPVFLGNFIHANEAKTWFALMNREIRTFSKRHKVSTRGTTPTWMGTFLGAHLYRCYYQFVARVSPKHKTFYTRKVTQNTRRFQRYTRGFAPSQRTTLLKAA